MSGSLFADAARLKLTAWFLLLSPALLFSIWTGSLHIAGQLGAQNEAPN